MDPEIVAQLEEQLRQLTETIANQTAMMGAQMDAMNKMGSSASRAAQATNRNTDTSTQSTTKYQEAQAKATAETDKSANSLRKFDSALGVLSAAVGGAAGVFGSLAGSLLSAQKGFAKYGQVADAAAQGAEGIAKSIPVVGDALGALVGTLGKAAAKIATDVLTLLDSIVTLRDGLAKTVGVLPVSADQLATLAKNAGFSGERMVVLGKVTESLGSGLRALESTAGRGAVKFMEMADVGADVRAKFSRMGVDQDRLLELQALYIKQQQGMGNAYDLQTKSAKQLQKESLAYAENMQKLSALTGKAAEEQQAEQDAINAVVQERMEAVKDLTLEKKLRDEGRTAEADEIKQRRLMRESLGVALAKENLTQEEQMKIKQMYRSGITDFNKSLLMVNSNTPAILNAMKTGAISVEEGAKQLAGGMREGQARFSTALSGVADYMSDDELKGNFNLESESLLRQTMVLKQSLGESTEAIEKDITARKEGTDEVADTVANAQELERQAQAKYQDFLMTQLKTMSDFINQTDLATKAEEYAKVAAYALAAGLAAVTAGQAALGVAAWRAARNLEKLAASNFGRGGGPGGEGPLGDAETKAKGKGGFLKRFGKRILGGVGGLLGGMALDYGAEKAEEAGYKKTSGALSTGSYALTGAGFGAMFGPIGAALGGVAGGLYGLYQNKDKLFGSSEKDKAKSPEQQAREKDIAALQKQLDASRKATGAPAAATAIPGAAKTVPSAAVASAAGAAGAAGVAGAAIPVQALSPELLGMNEKVLEDQLERNKKLFREPMQQLEEERKTQTQTFNDLSASMSLFRKNLDSTSKAFTDLMSASDELYKAMTGRDRPGSENAAPTGAPPGPGAATGNIPENVRGNLEKIAQGLRKAGYADENYINAVLANVMKESGGNFNKTEDIEGYANTENARIRDIFKTKTRGMSDAELTALKADPQAFANKMYSDRGGNKKPGDGWLFRGRGPIQLTGRGNYSKASKDIFGDDRLVQNPDLVMDPEVGTQVIAWFLQQNEKNMRGKLGLSKDALLSQQEAALLATSQIAGQAITAGKGYLGTENLNKVLGYAQQLPNKVGAGGSFSSGLADVFNANRGAGGKLSSLIGKGLTLGGGITGNARNLENIDPRLEGAMYSAITEYYQKTGKPVTITSGFRYPGDQDKIDSGNNPKAQPGFSRHERGLALDFNSSDVSAMNSMGVLSKYGLIGGSASSRSGGRLSDPPHIELQAARGGIFRGPQEGYPVELHGTEMIVPIDTMSKRGSKIHDLMSSPAKTGVKESGIEKTSKINDAVSQESYTVNGKPATKKQYESFMSSHPELQGLQDKVKSILTTMQDKKTDPVMLMKSASSLMDTNLTGIKDEIVDKNTKIKDSLMQLVSNETSKAISSITEANTPLQTISTEISNSMRKVMEAHNSTMNELTYKLGDMIDALNTSNDVTKKILKKASA